MADPKPFDFDWVTARHQQAIAAQFEVLRVYVKALVDARNTEIGQQRFLFHSRPPEEFSVFDARAQAHRRAVGFLATENTVAVRSQNEGHVIDTPLRPVVAEDGTARFEVGAQQLWMWQAVRKVLEPLLFDE